MNSSDQQHDRDTHCPVAEWPREKLKERKESLELRKAEIQGRIEVLEQILESSDE